MFKIEIEHEREAPSKPCNYNLYTAITKKTEIIRPLWIKVMT